tara:strand:- start:2156 stop:2620 length:465 start_codon:yes stop_codon:yes gene_type:complete
MLKVITDIEEAADLFKWANSSNHHNAKNYTRYELDKAWDSWTHFISYDYIAFCGIRKFGNYQRIFDRYYVDENYRNEGLMHAKHSLHMLDFQIQKTDIPFFTIEKQRKAIEIAVKTFNNYLEEEYFEVLNDKYYTMPNSLQHVAIKKGERFRCQ